MFPRKVVHSILHLSIYCHYDLIYKMSLYGHGLRTFKTCQSYNCKMIIKTKMLCSKCNIYCSISTDSKSLNSIKQSIIEYLQSHGLIDGRTPEKDRRTTGTFCRSLLQMGSNVWLIKFRIKMFHQLFVTLTQSANVKKCNYSNWMTCFYYACIYFNIYCVSNWSGLNFKIIL